MDEIAVLLSSPIMTAVAAAFGAVWGSFFNVCIDRIPAGQSIVRPGSRCGSCGTPIRAADNIPLISYFVLRGRCRACKQTFSARHPLVEALAALLAAVLWMTFVSGDPGQVAAIRIARFAVYFAFAGALIVLSFIDLASMRLPDVITLPAIPVFFMSGFAVHHAPWLERLIGAVAGYVFLRIIADFYYYVLKREGLGLGDAKLLAVIGALLGWRSLLFVLTIGGFAGALISLPIVLWTRRRRPEAEVEPRPEAEAEPRPEAKVEPRPEAEAEPRPEAEDAEPLRYTQVPFGPFLAAAALLYVFVGPRLLALVAG